MQETPRRIAGTKSGLPLKVFVRKIQAMYFAHRTWSRLAVSGFALVAYVAIVSGLALFAPGKSATFGVAFFAWSWQVPAALAAMALLEWLGTSVLSLPFWRRMPSTARVAALVGLVVVVVVLLVASGVQLFAR